MSIKLFKKKNTRKDNTIKEQRNTFPPSKTGGMPALPPSLKGVGFEGSQKKKFIN
jgi:hypothetical protein